MPAGLCGEAGQNLPGFTKSRDTGRIFYQQAEGLVKSCHRDTYRIRHPTITSPTRNHISGLKGVWTRTAMTRTNSITQRTTGIPTSQNIPCATPLTNSILTRRMLHRTSRYFRHAMIPTPTLTGMSCRPTRTSRVQSSPRRKLPRPDGPGQNTELLLLSLIIQSFFNSRTVIFKNQPQ